jgi:hypothetical protein
LVAGVVHPVDGNLVAGLCTLDLEDQASLINGKGCIPITTIVPTIVFI